MRALAVVLVCGGLALALPAAAASGAERVRISYEAIPGCPTEDEFIEAVLRDGGALDRSPGFEPVRTLAVTLTASSGHLTIRELDGAEATREIEGDKCDDVARSLAVLVALALEPRTEAPAEKIPGTHSSERTPEEAEDDQPPPLERWRLGLSAEGTLGTGMSPAAVMGGSLLVTIAHDAPGPFAPALLVGVETTGPGHAGSQGYDVPLQFTRRVVRADFCPLRFALRQPWSDNAISADACARLDVGALKLEGAQPPAAPVRHYTWAGVGAVVRVHWDISRLFLDLSAGAVAPLVRERFFQEPDTLVYETPRLSGAGGIGIGVWIL